MVAIYKAKGFSDEDAKKVISIYTSNKPHDGGGVADDCAYGERISLEGWDCHRAVVPPVRVLAAVASSGPCLQVVRRCSSD